MQSSTAVGCLGLRPLIFPESQVGVSTCSPSRRRDSTSRPNERLLGFHRAVPSTPLDKSIATIHLSTLNIGTSAVLVKLPIKTMFDRIARHLACLPPIHRRISSFRGADHWPCGQRKLNVASQSLYHLPGHATGLPLRPGHLCLRR